MNTALRRLFRGLLIFFLLPIHGTPPPPRYAGAQLKGAVGGSNQAVAIDADEQWAYAGAGMSLHAFDIHSMDGLFGERFSSPPLGGVIRDIAVSGAYAYLAAGDAGLVVVSLADRAQMNAVSAYETAAAWDVQISGSTAYLLDRQEGVYILDLSAPANPLPVNHLRPFDCDYYGLYAANGWVYTTCRGRGLVIFDARDPAAVPAPATVAAANAFSLAAPGDYAYLGGENGALSVVNVHDPAHPSAAVQYTVGESNLLDLAVRDGMLFAAQETGLACKLDLREPALPQGACKLPLAGQSIGKGARIAPGSVYLYATFSNDLWVVSRNKLTRFDRVDFPLSDIQASASFGGMLYTVGVYGLTVLDPRSPSNTIQYLGEPHQPMRALAVVQHGSKRYAIVACSSQSDSGLYVIDVSDPGAITLAGGPFTLQDGAGQAAALLLRASEGLMYAGAGSPNRLFVLDTSSLPVLTQSGLIALPEGGTLSSVRPFTWSVGGPGSPRREQVYVALGSAGLAIYDTSSMSSISVQRPALAGGPTVLDAAIAGERYFSNGPEAVYLAGPDTLDAWSPDFTRRQPLQPRGPAWELALQGNQLIAAEESAGLTYYNITDRMAPFLVGYARIPGAAYHVATGETGQVFAIDTLSGVREVLLLAERAYAPLVVAPSGE